MRLTLVITHVGEYLADFTQKDRGADRQFMPCPQQSDEDGRHDHLIFQRNMDEAANSQIVLDSDGRLEGDAHAFLRKRPHDQERVRVYDGVKILPRPRNRHIEPVSIGKGEVRQDNRIRLAVAEHDALPARERMVRLHNGADLQLDAGAPAHAAARWRIEHEPDIRFIRAERGDELLAVHHVNGEVNSWIAIVEFAEDPRQEFGGDTFDGYDRDISLSQSAKIVDVRSDGRKFPQCIADMFNQHLARGSQANAPRKSLEQLGPKRLFQVEELSIDGRRRDVEAVCSLADRAKPRDGVKVSEYGCMERHEILLRYARQSEPSSKKRRDMPTSECCKSISNLAATHMLRRSRQSGAPTERCRSSQGSRHGRIAENAARWRR